MPMLLLPSLYRTPENLLIDLRLLNKNLMKKIQPIIEALLKNSPERRLKLNNLRQKLISEHKGLVKNAEIQRIVGNMLYEEYFKILMKDILESVELEACETGKVLD